jgi:hypothetical protein
MVYSKEYLSIEPQQIAKSQKIYNAVIKEIDSLAHIPS